MSTALVVTLILACGAALASLLATISLVFNRAKWIIALKHKHPKIYHFTMGRPFIVALLLAMNSLLFFNLKSIWIEPFVVKYGDLPSKDKFATYAADNANLRAQREYFEHLLSHEESEKRFTYRPEPVKVTTDILCQNYAACPSAELARRALIRASEIEAIFQDYENLSNAAQQRYREAAAARAPESELTEIQKEVNQSTKGWGVIAISKYRQQYQSDTDALRKALQDRLADHSTTHDMAYGVAAHAPLNTNPAFLLAEIVADLRTLAGRLKTMPQ